VSPENKKKHTEPKQNEKFDVSCRPPREMALASAAVSRSPSTANEMTASESPTFGRAAGTIFTVI